MPARAGSGDKECAGLFIDACPLFDNGWQCMPDKLCQTLAWDKPADRQQHGFSLQLILLSEFLLWRCLAGKVDCGSETRIDPLIYVCCLRIHKEFLSVQFDAFQKPTRKHYL